MFVPLNDYLLAGIYNTTLIKCICYQPNTVYRFNNSSQNHWLGGLLQGKI